jgi:hypothetical protein
MEATKATLSRRRRRLTLSPVSPASAAALAEHRRVVFPGIPWPAPLTVADDPDLPVPVLPRPS